MTPLSLLAVAALRQMFFDGPTWDGDQVTKSGRDELIKRGLCFRTRGWASLTEAGVELAATSGMDREKEKRT